MSNPLDPPEGDEPIRNEEPIEPDEEVIPFEDTPVALPKKVYVCTGVTPRKLKRVAEMHSVAFGSAPDQGTTDASGKWVQGHCPTCGERTLWKEARL